MKIRTGKKEGDGDKLEATHYLSEIDVVEVTLTGYPAVPRAKFRITKSTGETEEVDHVVIFRHDVDQRERKSIEMNFKIAKVDDVKKDVFAFALFADEPDYHGSLIVKDEVVKACHSFLRNMAFGQHVGTGTGYEHKKFSDIGYPIESCIDYDGLIGKSVGVESTFGAWWLGVHVTNDEIWKCVESGEVTGFSIAGWAEETPINSKSIVARALHGLRQSFGITKGDGDAQSYEDIKDQQEVESATWRICYRLTESVESILTDDTVTDKKAMIEQSFKQAYSDALALIEAVASVSGDSEIFQSLKEASKIINEALKTAEEHTQGGVMLTEKDVSKMITDENEKLTKAFNDSLDAKLEALGEKFEAKKAKPKGDPPEPDPVAKSLEDITATLETVKTSIEDVSKRVEAMEKTSVPPNGSGPTGDEPKKSRDDMTKTERLVDSAKGTALSAGSLVKD